MIFPKKTHMDFPYALSMVPGMGLKTRNLGKAL